VIEINRPVPSGKPLDVRVWEGGPVGRLLRELALVSQETGHGAHESCPRGVGKTAMMPSPALPSPALPASRVSSAEAVPGSRRARLAAALSPPEWRRLAGIYGAILGVHLLGFALLALGARGHYRIDSRTTFGVGTGMLAYTLGLRHAFDADHIAAIDNTTRKLMNEGGRPLGVGFFFALGHSSVVMALAVAIGFGFRAVASQVRDGSSGLHHYAGLVGTSISGGFLLLLAAVNLVVLVGIVRVFLALRGDRVDDEQLGRHLASPGVLLRLFGSMARNIDASWKMYPLGILFGLGFETATEIALLVLAGTAVAGGLPIWALLSLPILFAAGMTLLDTTDGCFMNIAYSWAFLRPVRKLYYNLTITGLSIAVAVFIGGLEVAQVLAGQLGLHGAFWDYASAFDINRAGVVIVAMFAVIWSLSLAVWKLGRIEQRWEQAGAGAVQATAPSPPALGMRRVQD